MDTTGGITGHLGGVGDITIPWGTPMAELAALIAAQTDGHDVHPGVLIHIGNMAAIALTIRRDETEEWAHHKGLGTLAPSRTLAKAARGAYWPYPAASLEHLLLMGALRSGIEARTPATVLHALAHHPWAVWA